MTRFFVIATCDSELIVKNMLYHSIVILITIILDFEVEGPIKTMRKYSKN